MVGTSGHVTLTHIDLFSGIGGFALACRWNGIETVQFVEIDKRCRDFLSKAWPGVAIHDDIRTFHYDGRPVFLLTGGVPCQPASRAGKQRGDQDDRWLWPEAVRVLGEVKPAWAIFENPPGIGDVGLSGILSDVEAKGYDFPRTSDGKPIVFSVPACAVGSPQIRMRYWIVGRANEDRHEQRGKAAPPAGYGSAAQSDVGGVLANRGGEGQKGFVRWSRPDARITLLQTSGDVESLLADSPRRQDDCRGNGDVAEAEGYGRGSDAALGRTGEGLADAEISGRQQGSADAGRPCEGTGEAGERSGFTFGACDMGNASEHESKSRGTQSGQRDMVLPGAWDNFVWLPCADGKVRRAPDDSFGLVDGLHRSLLAALGNSIVPAVASEIIRAIVEAENE